jgi:hypothetical protein
MSRYFFKSPSLYLESYPMFSVLNRGIKRCRIYLAFILSPFLPPLFFLSHPNLFIHLYLYSYLFIYRCRSEFVHYGVSGRKKLFVKIQNPFVVCRLWKKIPNLCCTFAPGGKWQYFRSHFGPFGLRQFRATEGKNTKFGLKPKVGCESPLSKGFSYESIMIHGLNTYKIIIFHR